MNFLKLIDLYNESIYKSAGLVKVPEKLLKQIEDYAINAYLKQCKIQTDNIVKNIQTRNNIFDIIQDKKTEFSYFLENYYDIIDSLEVRSQYVLEIKDFDLSPNEENLNGTYDIVSDKLTLFIYIFKPNENYYNFSFVIDDVDIFSIKRHVSKQEITNAIDEKFGELDNIYRKFDKFTKLYKKYDDKQLIKANFFKNFIASKINDSDITKNIFKFDLNDLNLNIDSAQYSQKEFEFKVIFASSAKEKKKMVYDGDWAGLWIPNLNSYPILYVFQKIPLKSEINERIINADILNIKDTVRHELQHAFQTFVQRGRDLKQIPGLPSKIMRDKKYDPWGRPISKKEDSDTEVKSSEKDNKNKDRLEHHKMDIEFYTDLTDSISRYKQFVRNIPKPLWKTVFLYWIDQIEDNEIYMKIKTYFDKLENKQYKADLQVKKYYKKIIGINDLFFITLKVDPTQQEKYKKAVKEFYKEVSSDFENSTI